jgi:predicted PurR-regulated permease PerM
VVAPAAQPVARRPTALLAVVIITLLVLWFLYSIASILLLVFIAVLFSLYLGAITDALQRTFALPRTAGVLIAVLATFLALLGIGYLIVPPLVAQTQELLSALPLQLELWEIQLRELAQRSPVFAELLRPRAPEATYVGSIVQEVSGYFRGVVPYIFSGVGFMVRIFSIVAMGIYMALRPGMYKEGVIALAPPVHRELVRDILTDLGRVLRAWLVGQLIGMFVLAVLMWLGLVLLGVPYALAFGVFTGVVTIVPFFGTLISTLLPTLFMLGFGGFGPALLVAAWGLIVNTIEGSFVSPMIMERQVQLPPVLTLLSVLVMARLLDIIGVFVAVPALASAMVIVRRIYVQRVLEGKGFRRAIRDQAVEVRLPADGAVLVHPAAQKVGVPALLEDDT